MSADDRQRWDDKWSRADGDPGPPARVLTEYQHLLPESGDALDLACGPGRNALFLAARGLSTSAWDLSPVAIARLERSAEARGLRVAGEARDLGLRPPEPESFDVIVVSRFLERSLCPAIGAALKPGGLLFYETFVQDAVHDRGPRRRAFRLAPGELLALFAGLRVLAYHDEGRVGDPDLGHRDEAMLVAMRERAGGDRESRSG